MKAEIPAVHEGLPVIGAQAMRDLDRLAAQRGLATLDLMEKAGAAVAGEALRFVSERLGLKTAAARVVVLCGRGSNGGDGLVAARLLREAGAAVSVFLCPPKRAQAGAAAEYPAPLRANLDRARGAGVEAAVYAPEAGLAARLESAHLIVDALLGTGATGKPAGPVKLMIQEATRSRKPVLAVDIPSGIDPDSGYHSGVFIIAEETLALGLPKRGLLAPHAKRYVGKLKVLDIGYPQELIQKVAQENKA